MGNGGCNAQQGRGSVNGASVWGPELWVTVGLRLVPRPSQGHTVGLGHRTGHVGGCSRLVQLRPASNHSLTRTIGGA